METISTRSIHDIIKAYVSFSTVILYLNNYRFSQYLVTYKSGVNAHYILCNGFLNKLFTYLLARHQDKAAFKLQEHFKDKYKIKPIEWEEFICES